MGAAALDFEDHYDARHPELADWMAEVTYDARVGMGARDLGPKAEQAVENCPEQAIRIER